MKKKKNILNKGHLWAKNLNIDFIKHKWLKINSKLIIYILFKNYLLINIMKPILCFYMGYTPSFNGENYGTKNIFGSEITSIKLAESLTDIYDVYMFVNGLQKKKK